MKNENLYKTLSGFIVYLQYRGLQIGRESCSRGYVEWNNISSLELRSSIQDYLKEIDEYLKENP